MLSYIRFVLVAFYTFLSSFVAGVSALLDRSFTAYTHVGKYYAKGVFFLGGIKLKVVGSEKIDPKKVYVFVSNHSSQFDIPALQAAIPNKIGIVFKQELGKIPVFGWQLKIGPYIMVDRKNAESAMRSIEEAKEKMKQKKLSPVVFAEGTRSENGEVQSFKRGAFYLAVKAGYPIVPVSVSGSYKLLPKGKFSIKRGTITVTFDDPIDTSSILTRKDENDLMEKVRNIVIKNIKE
ncbi:MAG: 1-acyl-sn-glycerol-3-phosphate acyltransferase [Ignavibacteriaceae bacterium]|nr:1-acyl-sn-glycerol-3-phosphate acyltransferase [Ignavibacteriaceae bacterium]